MSVKLYVGNLNYDTTEADLGRLFESYGEVVSVNIITDRFSGRSKGFGFVEMAEKNSADRAISELSGKEFQGRTLRVNVARPKEETHRRRFKRR